jgi:hypothetical protein
VLLFDEPVVEVEFQADDRPSKLIPITVRRNQVTVRVRIVDAYWMSDMDFLDLLQLGLCLGILDWPVLDAELSTEIFEVLKALGASPLAPRLFSTQTLGKTNPRKRNSPRIHDGLS